MTDAIDHDLATLTERVSAALENARGLGASQAEASASRGQGLSATVRMREVETLEYRRDQGLAVTVYFGQRKGSASTSDLEPAAVREAVEKACSLARFAAEDEFAGLMEEYLREEIATRFPELDATRANPMSNTVYFRKPSDELVHEYTLATMDLERGGSAVPHAHVVVMPHATREVLDRFLEDLARDRAKRAG